MGGSGRARVDDDPRGGGVMLRFAVDYTPIHVDPVSGLVDWGAGCSNLSAAVGPFVVNQIFSPEERATLSRQLATVCRIGTGTGYGLSGDGFSMSCPVSGLRSP